MARSSTPQGSLRQRNVGSKKLESTVSSPEPEISKLAKAAQKKTKGDNERDYKIALAVITALAFITRFWGISHPNEVVFDEVHFGKVCRHLQSAFQEQQLWLCA
jgi:dolichyl-phosphate-mannose-protein mannosyltransferase